MTGPSIDGDAIQAFREAFYTLKDHVPFPWQERLFLEFAAGRMPSALDLPTGLGKTSVMAIWLIARALAGGEALKSLPRRLVYVVDRRAVVDQATEEAETLRKALDGEAEGLKRRLGFEDKQEFPISTLRGQHADNRAWLVDPTVPAIIVGTVDMIGSRLLFSGYGVSGRMRPYHAGLLGADTLVVLDEAHLVPPFAALMDEVMRLTSQDSERAAMVFRVPPLRLMALSATGRRLRSDVFRLEDGDMEDETVRRRVDAPKWLKLEGEPTAAGDLAEAMAARAIELAGGRHRVLVFCNSRKVAGDVHAVLEEYLRKTLGKNAAGPGKNLELIVGARRVRERERLAASPVFKRFAHLSLDEKDGALHPSFLVATSAGEVGVDIDADHMVCDLVAWERMVQRLGRVNRRGEFTEGSLIDVFVAAPDKEAETPPGTPAVETCRKPFDSDAWTRRSDGRCDASSGALLRLRDNAAFRPLADEATTAEPLRPSLTRAVLDAWSMTSLEAHPGRPKVEPWIRGWLDEDKQPPQTQVLWRRHLPIRENEAVEQARRALEAFFEAAPPHVSEILETEAFRVVEMLRARARAALREQERKDAAAGSDNSESTDAAEPDLTDRTIVAVVLAYDRAIKSLLRLGDIMNRTVQQLQSMVAECQVVLDARLGGLADSGLLDPKEAAVPATLDGETVATIADEHGKKLWSEERLKGNGIGYRVRVAERGESDGDWKVAYWRFLDALSEESDHADAAREWRVEEWVGEGAAQNNSALARAEQTLDEHHARIVAWAEKIARGLNLPDDLRAMLVAAARHHDCGKARPMWQRFAGNPDFVRGKQPPLAKFVTRGDPNLLRVGNWTYRHEFGSVRDALERKAFEGLPSLEALGLHLIATHHGSARPAIVAYDEKDLPGEDSVRLADRLREDMTALTAQWGPWGLAWWEALLRAADAAASREVPAQEAR